MSLVFSRSVVENEKLLENIREIARKTSNQYALYYYLYTVGKASLRKLYKVYCEIASKPVRLSTVRKQLKILEERYKVIRRHGEYYIPLLPPEELLLAINTKRAEAGRKGALKRVLYLRRRPEIQIPRNLAHYVSRVYEEVVRLLEKGDRVVVLDLLAHTYLPLRENEVLWLWRGNEFVYWDNKNRVFRSLYSEELSKLLDNLGYQQGILAWHVLGHERVSKIIKRIFGKGHLDWPWSRSIAYGLVLLGILKEGENYRVEILYRENYLHFILKNYYTGYTINEYIMEWEHSHLPPPLIKDSHYKGLALGVPHTNPKNKNNGASSLHRA